MKKLFALILIASAGMGACVSAKAHGYYHHGGYYRGGYHYNNWVAPAIVGGVIGYSLSRPYYEPYYAPPPVVYTQPPVVVSPPPVYQSTCTRYVYQDQYGNTTREETRCN